MYGLETLALTKRQAAELEVGKDAKVFTGIDQQGQDY